MNFEVERGGQTKTLLTTLYGSFLSRVVEDIFNVACKVVNDIHAAEFDSDGMADDEGKAVRGNSERVQIAAVWVPSAKKLYNSGAGEALFGEHDRAT